MSDDDDTIGESPDDNDDVTVINTAAPVPEDADGSLEAARAFMDPTQAELEREARKPDISWLDDAIAVLEDGTSVPLFDVGDTIVIERYATLLKSCPWLDTQTFEVTAIDDDTGVIKLWSHVLKQQAMNNFITGPKNGCVFKLPPARGSIDGKKRGRRPAPRIDQPMTAPPAGGETKRKGRGRPKGSKNRDREIIAAEKAERAKERAARLSVRSKR